MYIFRSWLLRAILGLCTAGFWGAPFCLPGLAESNAVTSTTAITNVITLNALPRNQKPVPFQIIGTVLLNDTTWEGLFMDQGGRVAYIPYKAKASIKPGTLLSLTGMVAAVEGNPIFNQLAAIPNGETALPEAKLFHVAGRGATSGLPQWGHIEGVIRSGRAIDRDHYELVLSTPLGRLSSVYLIRAPDVRPGIGSQVRVTGLLTPFGEQGMAYRIMVPNSSYFTVQKSNAVPKSVEIKDLSLEPLDALAPMVVVRGRLAGQKIDEYLTLAEGESTVRVAGSAGNPMVPGAFLEVRGFPEMNGKQLVLADPNVIRISSNAISNFMARTNSLEHGNERESKPLLTRTAQVRELPRHEAARNFPVQVRAVVTLWDPGLRRLFVADESGGIFVRLDYYRQDFTNGQIVTITGVSDPGGYAPVIWAREIEPGPMGTLPEYRSSSIEYMQTGLEDSQCVSIRGVAWRCGLAQNRMVITLLSASGSLISVVISGPRDNSLLLRYLRAELEVKGVCAANFTSEGQLRSAVLFVSGTNDIRISKPALENPFAEPPVEIAQLGQFTTGQSMAAQRHIRGIVTWAQPGKGFYLQDESGAIRVFPANNKDCPQVGVHVAAVGYSVRTNMAFCLGEAEFRVLAERQGAMNEPIDVQVTNVIENMSLHGRLVRLQGTMVDSSLSRDGWILTLSRAGVVFRVQGMGPMPDVPAAAECEVVGVCEMDSTGREVGSFILRARGSQDVRIITGPPLIRSNAAIRILEAMGVVIVTGLFWVTSLRRRVRKQTKLIQERLERENNLEARYRDLFENAPDLIIVSDLEGRIVSLNNAARLLFNPAGGTSVSGNLRGLLLPESLPLLAQALKCLLEGGTLRPVEFQAELPGGNRASLEATLRLVKHTGDQMVLECIARDITERKRMEDKLRQLSRAIEQCPSSIFLTNIRGEIEYANPKFVKLTGYSPEEVIGQNARILQSGETPRAVYKALWETILAGGEWQGEMRNRKKNGEFFWVRACISPITNQDGAITHFLSISEDITEQRHLEERLRHAQKMESVGQLASGVAHDFNNILTVIQGHAMLLTEGQHLDADTMHSLKQIAESSRRAAELTRQLLAFSRKQILKARPLDLNHLLGNLTGMLGPLLGEPIQLQLEYAPDLPPTLADSTMIEQVIMNLAVNSRDAMPRGGVLRIATFRHQELAGQNGNTGLAAGEYVGLRVSDTGCGMDRRTLSRIFEPFFTTKEVGKGTGLGLSTVYGIVKQHGGSIDVDSEPNQGTTFKVYFPASDQPAPVEAGGSRPTAQLVPGSGEAILIVEDEPALRNLVKSVLKRHGYRVSEAASGVEALKVWKENKGEFSLLLTDMVMPEGMNGRELADRLRAEKPRLRVIYSSGYHVELAGKDFVLRENDRFLPKPYRPDILVQFVQESLQNRDPNLVAW